MHNMYKNMEGCRKRTKRPSKQTNIEEKVNQMPTLSPQGSGEQISVSPLGISSASEDAVTGSLTERRRSSRKKVIKFDVRDLLNKNRKTHKIQIEARIDSNAPSDNKICISKINDGGSTSSLKPTVTSEELSVKKKNFMEKSAIFRRYSISAEQPKQPPQLPILPLLLNEVSDSKKSKPTSSLILAQMENSPIMVRQRKKKKQSGKLQTVVAETTISEYDKPQQKRRGRPPKAKFNPINGGTHDINTTQISQQTPDFNEAKEIVNQRSPKDATNWKEYKAALQQSSIKTFPTAISTTNINEIPSSLVSSALEELMSPSTPINISINADEPDITSSPFEEVIVETTTSPPITETNKVLHVEEYTANSTLLYTMEDCKYDDRTDTSTNENAASFNQSDNTSGSECGNNAPTNNLRSYKFGDKLRVNLKRLSLPKSPPDHSTNINEEVSGDDFGPYKELDLNSETSNDIKIITLTEQRFYYSPERSMNATEAIHCEEASEDPISNDICSVTRLDAPELIIRKSNKEECTDSQVVSDGTFDTDLIVIDDSSSNVYLPLEKMQYEHYDSKSHLQTPDDKENNHTEESLQSLCANQFQQVAREIENNVDTICRSSNSPEKLVLFEIGDSSNVTQISEVTDKTIEDFSINVINQELQVSVLKEDTNSEDSSREKEKKKEVRSEIKQSSSTLSKKGRKSRFKNLHSSDLDINTINEVNESSIESFQCATECTWVTQTLKNENENNETTKFFQKKKIQLLEELDIVECSTRNIIDDTSKRSNINVTNEKQKKSPESDVIVLAAAVEKPKDFEVIVTKSLNDASQNPIQCSSSCAENVQSQPSAVSTPRLETKLDTSVVHQVHIETNTLLDILRQVQCNNEANEIINKKTKESHCKLHQTCEVHPAPTPTPSTHLTSNTLSVDFQKTTATLKEGTLEMECNESSNVNDKRDEGSCDESGRTKTNVKDSKIPYKNMCRKEIIEKAQAVTSESKIENYKEIECFEVILTSTKDKSKRIEFCSSSSDKSYFYEDNTQSIPQHAIPEAISTAVGLKNVPLTANTSTPSIQKDDVKHIQPLQHGTKKHHNLPIEVELKRVRKMHSKKSKNFEQGSLFINKSELPQADSNTLTSSSPKKGKKLKNKSEMHSKDSKKKSDTIEAKTKLMQNSKQLVTNEIKNQYQDRDREVDQQGVSTTENPLEEKIAKKRRQSKLKEAFEAALSDDVVKKESVEEANLNISPKPIVKEALVTESIKEAISVTSIPSNVSTDVEDDPDPLKDIEKFIEDGVNLLKKDYKIDEDSINIVMSKKLREKIPGGNAEEEEQQVDLTSINSNQHSICIKDIVNTFETPSDTPIATPTVTPPPRSPTVDDANVYITPDSEENCGVRRSHRIKQITKTPKALVGRGLVRDRERFSIKDDVETKSHYTLDDHLTDLAEVEAKNAKFLKDMEERLSNFQVIKENEYKCERIISREAKKMICDCFLTIEEEERGELGCGEDCLNRLLMIECGPDCNVKERCTNKRFQKFLSSPCRVFRTEKKGFGIMADIEILPGEFIMEYVGEVIDGEEFEQRRVMYSLDKNRHYYFMALRSDAIIDATIKGNISRFINHSCDPNAETQKWTVNGELRIGFFSRKSIMPGEEITFDYQYQRYGREAQRCYCESTNCRGWIGQEPTSDEGEQVYDDSDYEEDEEEEDSPNLLVGEDDEEEDSDASGADLEEVQKKLERAAAEAEAELAPIALDESKMKELQKSKKVNDLEDSKSKFKNLLNKMAERVAAKQKQNKRELRMQRKQKTKKKVNDLPLSNKQRSLEDPDIEDEVEFLKRCGVKNQSDTLRLSRLMVRAKLVQTRLNLLEILCKGELPCRRLFLDYHGLRLVHGWMSEDGGNMQIRLALLQTLETLPIANKSVLTDTKVLQVVRSWCGHGRYPSPNDDSSKESCGSTSNYQDSTANVVGLDSSDSSELQKLASKLVSTWEGLPEIFRIPKKERIEQMKEHEREADRQYAASAQNDSNKNLTSESYHRDRFGRGISSTYNRFVKPNNVKIINTVTSSSNTNRLNDEITKNLSKAQRRKMFAAKVAREEAGKRMAEERREFETKCRFFGLDPKNTRPQDVPFCVNQFTGQWYSLDRKPISTPPIYAHVQLPVKPKSTDPADYQLPAVVATLPPQWKYTITTQGKIYYYHIKYRIPQWDPPSVAQLKHCELEMNDADSENEIIGAGDSSDDDDDILIGMNAVQLKAYIDKKVEDRRQKRYQRLVDERPISPRREEDRIYNQMEVRKYKENKEKIRKRKEGIRRKRAEALRQSALNMCTLMDGANTSASTASSKSNDDDGEASPGMLPIQDYLLSSDEENDIKAECNNSPLIDKIVEGDKIVDELDALTTKRQLKRILPPHRNFDEPSSSMSNLGIVEKQEYKKRKLDKKDKRKNKESDAKYRKLKEKFRCEIAGIIVHHLKPYRKDTCTIGRIQSNEDFNHLARKLTHFVMIKELKYCESVGQTLIVTESVKNKSREFIKKYMTKYGGAYIKPANDPEFKDIPYTL